MPAKSDSRRQQNRQQTSTSTMSGSSSVRINVYDISWLNEYIDNIGLGVFHTGIEVHDREYCYGGHQFGGSGIFEIAPKDVSALGPNYVFKTSIEVGYTDFTSEDVTMIVNGMESDFCGDQYHLLRKNCNHFSQAFIEILCGGSLPKWINRLAVVSTKLPFIERSIPKEWLTLQPDDDESGSGEVNSTERSPERSFSPRNNGSTRVRRETDIDQVSVTSGPAEHWRRFSAQVQQFFHRPSSSVSNGSITRSNGRGHRSNNNDTSSPSIASHSSALSLASSSSSSAVEVEQKHTDGEYMWSKAESMEHTCLLTPNKNRTGTNVCKEAVSKQTNPALSSSTKDSWQKFADQVHKFFECGLKPSAA